MLSIFKPAPRQSQVAEDHVDPLYRRLRWQIFIGIFFGYAAYYLVRKNFALAMPYLVEQGFSRGDLGFALSDPSPTAFQNSSWDRSLTAQTHASSYRQV
jgi:OPA family glycerol-3-phosphate transporter-like MFS transporter